MSVNHIGAGERYSVAWPAEDQEWVATTNEFPSLSWLAPPDEAVRGLDALVAEVRADLASEPHPGLASC